MQQFQPFIVEISTSDDFHKTAVKGHSDALRRKNNRLLQGIFAKNRVDKRLKCEDFDYGTMRRGDIVDKKKDLMAKCRLHFF